jgi:lysine N6-hydroxylase
MNSEVDVIAVGCGPFNLGLAALASGLDLRLAVLEARPELRWHPGLMFDDAVLQLSFLADLVTLVDPSHPLSFLAFLQAMDRLYPFFIREQFHPSRREYEEYLRWVVTRLDSIRFSQRVEAVRWDVDQRRFVVEFTGANGSRSCLRCRDLVLGIGTEPCVPEGLAELSPRRLLHSADYLERSRDVDAADTVTVVGSGQSAAEVVVDLLRRNLQRGPALTWITRTRAFAPLDYTKLVLEMTTPAYVRYFHALPQATKDRLNAEQWQHYKGISAETLAEIYRLLYDRELASGLKPVELRCGVAVEPPGLEGDGRALLSCRHLDTGARFRHSTSLVVAATGYRERLPEFLAPIEPFIRRDERGRYRVRLNYSVELDPALSGRIFVANAELHSHGAATPDLGVSAYRNASILNTILAAEVYRLPVRTAFTSFGAPALPAIQPASITSAPAAGPSLFDPS